MSAALIFWGRSSIRMLTRLTPSSRAIDRRLAHRQRQIGKTVDVGGARRQRHRGRAEQVHHRCLSRYFTRTTGAVSLTDPYYDDALLVWDPAMSATLDIEASVGPYVVDPAFQGEVDISTVGLLEERIEDC